MNIIEHLITFKNYILYIINELVYRDDINKLNILLSNIENNKNTLKQNDEIDKEIELKIIEHNKFLSELIEKKTKNDEKEQEILNILHGNITNLHQLVNKNDFLEKYLNNLKNISL